jgi:hypothetical protein
MSLLTAAKCCLVHVHDSIGDRRIDISANFTSEYVGESTREGLDNGLSRRGVDQVSRPPRSTLGTL